MSRTQVLGVTYAGRMSSLKCWDKLPLDMKKYFIIKQLRRLAQSQMSTTNKPWAKFPLTIFDEDPNLQGRAAVREVFGSERDAFREAGVWSVYPTKEELRRSIFIFLKTYEMAPTARDARDGLLPYHPGTYARAFGSWELMLNNFGLATRQQLQRAEYMRWRRNL